MEELKKQIEQGKTEWKAEPSMALQVGEMVYSFTESELKYLLETAMRDAYYKGTTSNYVSMGDDFEDYWNDLNLFKPQ